MGMYDNVIAPNVLCQCGALVDGWQSKDGPCTLDDVHINDVDNFYSHCRSCGKWFHFIRKEPKQRTVPAVPTQQELDQFSLRVEPRSEVQEG